MRRGLACLALLLAVVCGQGAAAQQDVPALPTSPILTIDSDRLYSDSKFGQDTAREFEAKGAALANENRKIEAQLSEEERALTEQRAAIEPAAFRDLANAFDEKVQAIRKEQDAKTRALNQELEARRVQFLQTAAPVLEDIMRQAGAAVVLERRSVFLSANAIDITGLAIEKLNAALVEATPSDD